MKVLVAVKRVIDHNVRVKIAPDGSGIDATNVKMSINPFDEIAVEAAVRLKEAGAASEIVAVSVGDEGSVEVLRTALALGADRGILLKTSKELQPLAIANLLASICKQEGASLFLLGKQAIDGDFGQTGQMVAALLDWPQATFASRIHVDGERVEVQREVDGGEETVLMRLPAVITADLRLNEPRYISLQGMMKAKRKPVAEFLVEDFGVDLQPRLRVLQVQYPPARKPGRLVDGVPALLHALKHDEKIV